MEDMAKRAASQFYARLEQALTRKLGVKPTQQQIATKLGIRQSAVSYWKTQGPPSMELLMHLADWSGACLEWLAMGRGPMYPDAARGDPFLETVCEILASLPVAEKMRFLEYLRWRLSDQGHEFPRSLDEAMDLLKSSSGTFKRLS